MSATDKSRRLYTAIRDQQARDRIRAYEAPPRYRIIIGRVAYIGGLPAETLPAHLRRVADEVERIEALECHRQPDVTEGISHLTVQWDEQNDWTTLLVIE